MTTPLFLSSSTDASWGLCGRVATTMMGSLFALALLAVPVNAQSTVSAHPSPTHSTWQQHYGTQAAQLLRSDIEEQKTLALRTLLKISTSDRKADLSPVLPALFTVYESDPTLGHRIMAMSVLRQVADRSVRGDRIMQRLGTLVADQSSKRVQRLTLMVLAEYENGQGRALRITPDLYKLFVEQGRA